MRAISRNGSDIIGRYETCPCRAEILPGSFERSASGKIAFEWLGGTEMFYDAQEPIKKDGQSVFLDENGDEWTEDQITLVDDDDDNEED